MSEGKNPWHFKDLEDFLYYCCPECNQKNQSKDYFLEHALHEHPKSKEFLETYKVKKEQIENEAIKSEYCNDNNEHAESLENFKHFDKKDSEGKKTSLKLHEQKYQCEFCQKVLTSLQAYDIHIINDHSIGKNYIKGSDVEENDPLDINVEQNNEHDSCPKEIIAVPYHKISNPVSDAKDDTACDEKDEQSDHEENRSLNSHIEKTMTTHHSSKKQIDKNLLEIKCEICEKTFTRKVGLKYHIKSIHQGIKMQIKKRINKKLPCEICGKTFTQNTGLKGHMKSIHQGIKDEKCEICGKTFALKCSLYKHQKFFHERIRKYICDICGLTFAENKDLKKHVAFIHEKQKPQKPFTCDECGKKFRSNSELNNHKKYKHEGIEDQKCDQCGKTFSLHKALLAHMRNVHTTESIKACAYCGKNIKGKGGMKVHIRNVHEGNRDTEICNLCGKSVLKKSFKVHVETVHEKQRNFLCKQCGKTFAHEGSLKTHIKSVHEGNKAKCDICGKDFSQISGVYLHQRNVHKVDPFKYKDILKNKEDI